MVITAAMVKELREISGAGMTACKNALTEADGVMERAVEILREKGLAAAAKKAGRIAAEGLVTTAVSDDRKRGAVVEVNSETDFVAKNKDFVAYVNQVAAQALSSGTDTMDALLAEPWVGDSSVTVRDACTQKVAAFGENVSIRRFQRYQVAGDGAVIEYVHGGGRVAVLLEVACAVTNDALVEVGRNVCMQIAAMSPQFVAQGDIPAEFIEKEKEILTLAAMNEGKPEAIAKKMVEGRLKKELQEFCLLEQEYVRDGEMNVAKYLDSMAGDIGAPVTVKRFVRYETGEGIQKKEENFAEEVSKAMNV